MRDLIVAGSLVLCACAAAPAATRDRQVSPDRAQADPAMNRYEPTVSRYIEWFGLTGLTVATIDHGHAAARSFGLASVELNVPARNDTVYQLSSTSKIVVGVMVLMLQEQGRLTIDDPLSRHLPELPPDWGRVTIRQALSHISGLPEILECEPKEIETALACVLALPRKAEPGERFEYNQTNAFLIQRLLETATGLSYPDLVAERLFGHVGMTASVYEGNVRRVVPGRAVSYYPDGSDGLIARDFDFPPFLYAAAGLNSTAEDLTRLMIALTSGELLSDDSRTELWRAAPLTNGGSSSYGLGWDINHHANGRTSVGHEGGYLTTVRYFPDIDLTVIVLANGSRFRFRPDQLAEAMAGVADPSLLDPGASLRESMMAAMHAGNFADAVRVYESRDRAESAAAGIPGMMNRLGYDLLERKRTAEAVQLFELCVRDHPDDWNAHDSLAESYLAAGDTQRSIEHYRESLRLNPENDNARKQLERICSGDCGSP